MVWRLLPSLLLCAGVFSWNSNALAQISCLVADPTGTPLNVRADPNGKIIGTLTNGSTVKLTRSASSYGKEWAYVSRSDSNAPLGWVFRNYLNCDHREHGVAASAEDQNACLVADPTGTPLNVRTEPNGRIVDTLRNGVLLTIIGTRSSYGKEWANVGRADTGAPLGWVFRDYLNCGKRGFEVAASPGNGQSAATSPDLSSPAIIQLKSDGGTFVVPLEINGAITLDFVVDSGASDVSVPADVVSTLIRTRTIGPSDFVGQQTYVLADGSEAPSEIFIIRSLKVGGLVVRNVRASIASPKAPLLLGQSFLRNFRSWSIDNARHALILE